MSQATTQPSAAELVETVHHFLHEAEKAEKHRSMGRSTQAVAYNRLCTMNNVPERQRYRYMCKLSKDHGMTDQEEIDNIIGWADILRQYPNAPKCVLGWQNVCENIGISAKNNRMLKVLAELSPEAQAIWKTLD